MIRKIGTAWVDPAEIAAVSPAWGGADGWAIFLRSGRTVLVECSEGDLFLALSEAGVYDPDAECADCDVELPWADELLRPTLAEATESCARFIDRLSAAMRHDDD